MGLFNTILSLQNSYYLSREIMLYNLTSFKGNYFFLIVAFASWLGPVRLEVDNVNYKEPMLLDSSGT